jgi:poly-gamma-glutamate synthesis protein (capsule biosynthesis protein)
VIGWETDTATEFFFMGRKFAVSDDPGTSTYCYREDVDRILKYVREARRQADIVIVAVHDQSHGFRGVNHITAFAHESIDAGADVYVNHGGHHGGVEIYKGKVIIHGQPPLFLQNNQIAHVPSSAMPLLNLSRDATAADFLEAREQTYESSELINPTLTSPDFWVPGGSAVHVLVFDGHGDIKEVRVQPLELTVGPRHRRGLPVIPDQNSETAKRVLDFSAARSEALGTEIIGRDEGRIQITISGQSQQGVDNGRVFGSPQAG